jgi:tRNA U34 5-methylaminomethyl-2-thiouridine-forming methyltransferase MnmC
MFERELYKTADGSYTLRIQELDENYHSGHGALQEAIHVFIENGLKSIEKTPIHVFEMGFGTGLNALLTLKESILNGAKIDYVGIEAYPVEIELIKNINYSSILPLEHSSLFDAMHGAEWGISIDLTPHFSFEKIHAKIEEFNVDSEKFDIVYFDAFGPRAQGEMWERNVLSKMHQLLKIGGVLVTYCAKGQFKRDLKSLGFEVQSLPGPPGKREMTRAIKIS